MRLIGGDFKKGVRQALTFLRKVIDDQTQLRDFKHLCISRDGSFQLDEGSSTARSSDLTASR
jgi:hypothetical protein